jgi:hypothetical protein
MSIALFIESEAEPLDGLPATYQTILFGYKGEVHIHNRVSNGSKGKGQAWKRMASDELYMLPDTTLTTKPVGVITTDRDMDMVGLGLITNIGIKALYANESAEKADMPVSHKSAVILLGEMIREGNPSLAEYVTDKRTATGFADVEVTPLQEVDKAVEQGYIVHADTPMPIPAIAEPVDYRATAPVSDNEFALNMVSVPDIKYSKQYINRRFDGVTDWEIYDKARDPLNPVNVLLEGQAGSGKTMSVQAYASARGLRYFNISSNQGIDPSQLFGRWIPRSDGQGYMWQDGAVTLLFRHGGVLLINEVNFLPTRISTVLFSGLDYRREIQLLENGGEVIKAHPNLLIVADMNYGYKGTQELNQAFSDRFGIKLEFPYDRAIENKVVKNKALLTLADQLREQYEKEEISTPISTRSLVAFINNANNFGVNFAITSFTNGFHKDERGGVRLACETHKDNIAQELGQAVPTFADHSDMSERI